MQSDFGKEGMHSSKTKSSVKISVANMSKTFIVANLQGLIQSALSNLGSIFMAFLGFLILQIHELTQSKSFGERKIDYLFVFFLLFTLNSKSNDGLAVAKNQI